MKKFIALLLVAVMCFSLGIGGTVAYLTDRETETNVFTVGDVDIELHEKFAQGSKLLPGVEIEKEIKIENTGSEEAWVFYTYAVPTAIKGVVVPTFKTNTEWAAVSELKDTVDINGVNYTNFLVAYNKALEAGKTTDASMLSVKLDSRIDAVDGKWVLVKNDNGSITTEAINWEANKAPTVYVAAYAIQTTGIADVNNNGIDVNDAISAYTTQWGGLNAEYVTPVVVDTVEEFTEVLTNAGKAGAGDSYIVLASDLDMSEVDWTPINVDGYHGAGVVTIDGGYNTIKRLDAPLFEGGFAGESGIVIKNLTIADSEIVSTSNQGGGAFIDTADSMQVITLENCHLVNSTVNGERTGGLVGWVSGYANLNDGPVKTYVTIKDCSVIDCEINGAGSVGGIVGHPGASDYTYTTIENCTVLNNILASTDAGDWRVGAIVGTANNGHVVINNCTVGENTLSQTGKTAKNDHAVTDTNGVIDTNVLVGRFVPSGTGTLEINGVTKAATASDSAELKDAIEAGASTVILGDGEYIIPDSAQGKTLTIVGNGDTVVANQDDGSYEGCDYSLDGATVTFENVTITTDGHTYAGYARCNATYNNCTINGSYTLYGESVFNNCTFNVEGDYYNIWTWGGKKVEFNNCTFNTDGKSILVYNQSCDVYVNGCTFNDRTNGTGFTKSALETGVDGVGPKYNIYIKDTTFNGFAENDKCVGYKNIVGNKNSMTNEYLNIVVDGVDVY